VTGLIRAQRFKIGAYTSFQNGDYAAKIEIAVEPKTTRCRNAVAGAERMLCENLPMPPGAHSQAPRETIVDIDGQSHFREIEIECSDETPWGFKVSKQLPATAISFVEATGTNLVPLHPAPCRQFVINLDAGLEITASDGERRVIGVGEVVLVEDTTGKGHMTKLFGDKPAHGIFVRID
jgi:hypothetical protein